MPEIICPSVIDFEASGFGAEGYPVEVGIVKGTGERYCSLIKPHPSWNFWDPAAELLHGISREFLMAKGKPIDVVCREMNVFANSSVLYSDAWVHDKPWMTKLFFYAGITPYFELSPIESIVFEEQLELWDEVKQNIVASANFTRHRASNDALIIQTTYLESRRLYLKRIA